MALCIFVVIVASARILFVFSQGRWSCYSVISPMYCKPLLLGLRQTGPSPSRQSLRVDAVSGNPQEYVNKTLPKELELDKPFSEARRFSFEVSGFGFLMRVGLGHTQRSQVREWPYTLVCILIECVSFPKSEILNPKPQTPKP